MIEVSNLTHIYGKATALKKVSFKLNNGKIYGVFGAADAGKSTLLALLAGAIQPSEGSLRVNGFDTVTEHRAVAKCVGYAPCNTNYYKSSTVYELLDFVADAKGVRDDRRFLHVHEIMEQTGLDSIRDRLIGKLSPLDLKCLNIAQALIGSPEVLLLDEPTAGLEPTEQKMILDLIEEIAQSERTVFYATSDPNEILSICTDVIILRNGIAEHPTPLSEFLNTRQYALTVLGEKNEIEALLSSVEGAIACRRLPSEEANLLRYAVQGEGEQFPSALKSAFSKANISAVSLRELPQSEAETTLRAAAKEHSNRKKGGDTE